MSENQNANCIIIAFENKYVFIFNKNDENREFIFFTTSDVGTSPGLKNIRVSMYRCIDVSMYRCIDVSIHRYIDTTIQAFHLGQVIFTFHQVLILNKTQKKKIKIKLNPSASFSVADLKIHYIT